MQIRYWPPKRDDASSRDPERIMDVIDAAILYDKPSFKASIFVTLADGRELEFYSDEVVPQDITNWERCIDQGSILNIPEGMKIRTVKSVEQVAEEHRNTDVRAFERSDFTFEGH